MSGSTYVGIARNLKALLEYHRDNNNEEGIIRTKMKSKVPNMETLNNQIFLLRKLRAIENVGEPSSGEHHKTRITAVGYAILEGKCKEPPHTMFPQEKLEEIATIVESLRACYAPDEADCARLNHFQERITKFMAQAMEAPDKYTQRDILRRFLKYYDENEGVLPHDDHILLHRLIQEVRDWVEAVGAQAQKEGEG